jgi:methylmalonyl-CoA/ethylmalonyl-CoA epimerase
VSPLASLRTPGTAPVHQVGIVVADIERAIASHTRLLGLEDAMWRRASFDRSSVSELSLRGAPAAFSTRLAFAGSNPELELIEPVDGPSIYHDWLGEHGDGVHHLAVAVTSLAQANTLMEAQGFEVTQAGFGFAPGLTGGFAYYDTARALGYVLEAIELP